MTATEQRSEPLATAEPTGRGGRSRARLVRLSALCGFTCVALAVGFFQLYTTYGGNDDEGYILLSLKQFVAGGSLYHDVFTQYGPFPYELWGSVYSLIGTPVTPDNARVIVLIVWVAIALLMWRIVERLTGSLALGLATALAGFAAAAVIGNEPMYPGGLAELLIVGIMAAAVLLNAGRRVRMVVIGALLAALVMTKINLGGSAVLATCLVLTASSRLFAGRRWLLVAVTAATAAVPFALMGRNLAHSWAENLAVMISMSVIALGIALSTRRPAERTLLEHRELAYLAAAFIGALIVIAVIIIILGTSPGELIHGVLIGPLSQPSVFTLPIQFPSADVDLAIAAVVWAAGMRAFAGGRATSLAAGVARIVSGLAIWLWISGTVPIEFSPDLGGLGVALPLAWLAAMPPTTAAQGHQISTFTRGLVAGLPIVTSLVIYPVAGSQVGLTVALFSPAAGVIVFDGMQQLAAWHRVHRPANVARWSMTAHVAAAGLVTALAYQLLVQPVISQAKTYSQLEAMPFRGTTEMHLPRPEVQAFGGVVLTLLTRCSTFITYPGLNSFYLWSGITPPTDLNTTTWMYLLNSAQQQRILNAVATKPNLCLLRNDASLEIWTEFASKPPPVRPLLRFVESGWKTIYTADGYQVMVRS